MGGSPVNKGLRVVTSAWFTTSLSNLAALLQHSSCGKQHQPLTLKNFDKEHGSASRIPR